MAPFRMMGAQARKPHTRPVAAAISAGSLRPGSATCGWSPMKACDWEADVCSERSSGLLTADAETPMCDATR